MREPSTDGDFILAEAEKNQLAGTLVEVFALVVVLGLAQIEANEQRTLALVLVELHVRPVSQVACCLLSGLGIGCGNDAQVH